MFAAECPEDDAVLCVMWLACFDPSESNADLAQELWDISDCTLRPELIEPLIGYLGHRHRDVRLAASEALSACIQVGAC